MAVADLHRGRSPANEATAFTAIMTQSPRSAIDDDPQRAAPWSAPSRAQGDMAVDPRGACLLDLRDEGVTAAAVRTWSGQGSRTLRSTALAMPPGRQCCIVPCPYEPPIDTHSPPRGARSRSNRRRWQSEPAGLSERHLQPATIRQGRIRLELFASVVAEGSAGAKGCVGYRGRRCRSSRYLSRLAT